MSGARQHPFSGWQLARESFAFVAAHLGQALRVIGPWLVVVLLATYWFMLTQLFLLPDTRRLLAGGQTLAIALTVARLIAWGLAYGVVAVAWHRLVLRGEIALATLLPSRAALLYLLLIVAIYIVVWIPYIGIIYVTTVTYRPDPAAPLIVILALSAVLVVIGFAMRISLKFPAIALRDREMTLRRSWAETATMWPGLLWGTLVISVPTYLLSMIVAYIGRYGYAYGYGFMLGVSVLNTVIIFLSILVYATFLSLAYRRTNDDISATFA